MAKARMAAGLVSGCLILCGAAHAANPSAADLLCYRPTQEGVVISTPTPQEQAGCEVKAVNAGQRGSGWQLRDAKGQTLRRILNGAGGKGFELSYFHDGVEVYREIDTNGDGKPDQFRWLNTAGSKWGIDVNGDGKIDGWRMISAEEAGQEVLQAVVARDYNRLRALLITEAEIKWLNLSADETARLAELQKNAQAKFSATVSKLSLGDKARWERLETAPPQCVPADASGAKQDVVKYARASILYENNGKHDWLQTGELIQVGLAWRLTDAPTPGDGQDVAAGNQQATDPALQKLLDQLRDLDTKNKGLSAGPQGPNAAVAAYNLERATLLEQITGKVKAEEREQWIKQIADCLGTAVQTSAAGDETASKRMNALVKQIVTAMPGSNLAAYVAYREMLVEHNRRMAGDAKNFGKIQEEWLASLAKFVETYSKTEDTPDALLELGMVSEFIGKEAEAKRWYEVLSKNFAEHQLAAKAKGALRRLDLEGRPMELTGALLQGGTFSLNQLAGKVVVVYYWASWNDQCVGDFAKLKLLLSGTQNVELVCVNLDNSAAEANAFLQRSPAPGIQLHQPGGLESPLAAQYGILVTPHLFLVGKDGKVLSRTVQVSNLEDEVKKALK